MNHDHHDHHDHHDPRVTRLEALVETLAAQMAEGFADLKQSHRQTFGALREELHSEVAKFERRTQPQTGVILQIIGIGITIAVIAGGVLNHRIQSIEQHNEREHDAYSRRYEWLESEVLEHHEDGHPHVVVQMVHENRDRLTRLQDRTDQRFSKIESKRWSENDPQQDEKIRALERAVFGKE